MDFTEYYDLVEEGRLFDTVAEARVAADNDDGCIWFVRHGDSPESDDEDEEWSVEPLAGQFVNRVGYFVTTEPRRPEHIDQVFTY